MTQPNQKSPVGQKPIKNGVITCAFGVKGTSWKLGYHPGVDFRCKHLPVYAYQSGRVVYVGFDPQLGNYIKTENKHTGITCKYAHLKEIFVNLGTDIEQGHPIAESGNSGVNRVTGKAHPYHLHFETLITQTREPVEPLFYEDEESNGKAESKVA